MAFRRRRKTGTWFPTIPNEVEGVGIETWEAAPLLLDLVGDQDGSVQTGITAVTLDESRDLLTPITEETRSLADVVGSEYFLNRLVGKLFLRVASTGGGGSDEPLATLIGCGFFIARANGDNTAPQGFTDQSSETDPAGAAAFSPLSAGTIREPWIWRRTFILSKNANVSDIPQNNWAGGYGAGLFDGPHFDAKTKRRVAKEERLWFAMSMTNWPYGSPGGEQPSECLLKACLDLRIFAGLRKAKDRGVF